MHITYKLFITLILLFNTTLLVALPPGPPRTPIDGGLGLLLAGGAAYGIKKIRDHKRGKQEKS